MHARGERAFASRSVAMGAGCSRGPTLLYVFVEFVEIEEGTNYVKVRLGGACTSCAMSAMTLKQGIENKIMQDIPDCNGVIQVL